MLISGLAMWPFTFQVGFQPRVLSLIAFITMSAVIRFMDWLCPITREALAPVVAMDGQTGRMGAGTADEAGGQKDRNVPGRMVCGIHVEPDISHPHDPHTKASFYSEPCISTGNITYHDRYCSSDSNSIHTTRSCTRSCCFTGIIFCISDPMYSAVHDAGNKLEKSICPLLWRIALGGGKNELERIMDDTFWNLRMVRT